MEPPELPPRPDLPVEDFHVPQPMPGPRRRKWPRWLAVVLVIALMTPGLVALRNGIRDRPPAEGPHAFFRLRQDGTPYRWPCEPIHYIVNTDHMPGGALDDLHEAFRRVERATGIPVVFDGEAQWNVEQEFRSFQGYDDELRWDPILITWVDHEEFSYVQVKLGGDDHALAFGYPKSGDGNEFDRYVSGIVVIDSSKVLADGFSGRYSEGPVLMHELAHVMGLGHVGDPGELMYSSEVAPEVAPDLGQSDWGPGDREGLRELGSDCAAH